ncbi:hypothetical protein SAMN05216188_107203 [Lentzea xinjiangensis]|uniref:Uncharacterized protein n=1 Tax=Lentzea xinjiangensis TaxID=402600 RepID=A0A1H9L0R7_9PSEU|nr:hypothetical protein SAMN05216188_107203 [Lentzea xinjiangensis]
MRTDRDTVSAALTAGSGRAVHLVTGAAVGGGLVAAAAPWWAWAVLLLGLWLTSAALRRMTPSHLFTRCGA